MCSPMSREKERRRPLPFVYSPCALYKTQAKKINQHLLCHSYRQYFCKQFCTSQNQWKLEKDLRRFIKIMSAIIYSWFSRTILTVTSPKLSGVNIPCNDAFDEIDKTLSSFYKKFNKIVEQAHLWKPVSIQQRGAKKSWDNYRNQNSNTFD